LTSEATAAAVVTGPGTARFEFSPHNCFACGTLNTQGLQLRLHVERGRSWTELTLEPRFEGWEGIAHGGILCTILDEVMAWALVGEDNWGLTARMAVDFKRPAHVGRPLRADGWVTRTRRRLVETAGQIVDTGSSEVLATAEAVYLAADSERKRELQERYGFRLAPGAPDTGATPSAPSDAAGETGR
jgi:acyl-coenzyme A thioesterase PaaI-like protein